MKGMMRFGKKGKLSSLYVGLYQILRSVGKVAYELHLTNDLATVHSNFDVSLLKKFVGDSTSVVPLEGLGVDESFLYEEVLIEILDRQVKKLRNKEVSSVKADVRRRDLEFDVNDWVYLKISLMKGVMRFGKKGKLSSRYVGPYQILRSVSKVAYELHLTNDLATVHSDFHVSILKKFVGDSTSVVPLEGLGVDESLLYEEVLIEILDRQVKKLRNKEVSSVKVLWKNHLVEGATWEAEAIQVGLAAPFGASPNVSSPSPNWLAFKPTHFKFRREKGPFSESPSDLKRASIVPTRIAYVMNVKVFLIVNDSRLKGFLTKNESNAKD
ncbi:hypothetical protein MTR67_006761 [Solanum verrucosum]|uniref:Tf2-1-like SH3-like domain-containing protein n=1 Tax=Solanum verrucosum TaxID=315347 RepID=A0AAF0Q3T2_SOLVR|nr:hypothetical protein MTR67_006761 [Solanum verrucosum]